MTYIQSPQAIHEAGHAVMLHHFGVRLWDVRIYPAQGCIPHQGGTTVNQAAVSALCSDGQAAIILAGFVADCHHARRPVVWSNFGAEPRYASDRERLTSVLRNCRPVDADDDDDEIIDRPVKCWLHMTEALVVDPPFWRAILALASRLAVEHQMGGKDAMEIIDLHAKPV